MFAFYGTLISSVELLSRTGSKYILGEGKSFRNLCTRKDSFSKIKVQFLSVEAVWVTFRVFITADTDTDAGIKYECMLNCEDSVASSLGDLALIAFAEFIGENNVLLSSTHKERL